MRIGLLGTGHWAQKTQGPALAAHPEAELAGVWGRDPAKAEALAGQLGTAAYSDVDKLIAGCDALSFSLPPAVQGELALRAARAGKHLILDKPVALDPAVADAIAAEAADRGLATVVFFTNRFQPATAAFLSEAAARPGWTLARIQMLYPVLTPGSPYADSVWRQEHGGLWDLGPHALSLALPVLGPVEEIKAMTGAHRTSHLLLRHAGGAVSSLALSIDAPHPVKEVAFYGESGKLALPDGRTEGSGTAFGVAISDLIANVRGGRTAHPCDVAFGAEVVRILSAAAATAQ
ncbi:Gfo/Idh/MocA family protein [Longispora albida]|uniref:Gfo/Idh/MocA family protein n=1 Tax=Longispora albida TaxID=203523 RepID=UPI0003AA8CEB|nr:Gfo/Idh/MocA family oxidoreductase [Longispora albida]